MALLDKLKFSKYSLKGQPGPNFENVGQKTTSDIQALAPNGELLKSQDLLSGRKVGSNLAVSNPPVSAPDNFAGQPFYPALGGTYSQKGPKEGRY
jgi:hypothetical protein